MSLDHAILGFLSEHPRSGYDLKTRCFEGAAAAFWPADQAQIYRTLERLSKGKAVTSRRRRQTGRPDRRIYELTPLGAEQLDAWLAEPQPLPALRDPFLLQLWFSARVSDEELERLLALAREEHQARLDELRTLAAEVAGDTTRDARTTMLRQVALDGAISAQRASVDWLDDALELVRAGLPGEGDPVAKGKRRRSGR